MIKNFSIAILLITFSCSSSYSQTPLFITSDSLNAKSLERSCNFYLENSWLPDSYKNNAYCACAKLPNTPEANGIYLQLKKQLQTVNDSIIALALSKKNLYKTNKISKHHYKKFVKKTITPLIYKHHVIAYNACGCKGKPAAYFAWKQITTTKVKNCNLIWLSIRCFGSCSKRFGKW